MKASIYVMDFGLVVDNGLKTCFFTLQDKSSSERMIDQICNNYKNRRLDDIKLSSLDVNKKPFSVLVSTKEHQDVINKTRSIYQQLMRKTNESFKVKEIDSPYDVEKVISIIPKSQQKQIMLTI